jgi:hypothetical protein
MNDVESKWHLVWSDYDNAYEERYEERDEVMKRVIALHKESRNLRPLIEIFLPSKGGLGIGLGVGVEQTVLTFQDSVSGPYFVSVGEADLAGMSKTFCHAQQAVDYFAYHLVPWKTAVGAFEGFLLTLTRPGDVEWEQI